MLFPFGCVVLSLLSLWTSYPCGDLERSLTSSSLWSLHQVLKTTLGFPLAVLVGQVLHLHTRRRPHCIHPQSWYWPKVLVNWQLVLAGKVALVQWAECFKKFQVHFEVLHPLRLFRHGFLSLLFLGTLFL